MILLALFVYLYISFIGIS